MRKYHQSQILELLKTIRQAQSNEMYAECQEGALSICDFIEDIVGEGTHTSNLLIEYCELLFKVHSGEANKKTLHKHLIKIENNVKSELKPTRTEMVFLSYKASMSDSLESIYFAAKADPDCDAFWIPIPYFERNPDGSPGKMHYEGPEFYGSDFDIVDWQEYDIGARRPDAIFTFNPFDGMNYVTSVHPDFYCERLRNLTDALIYVPYSVTRDFEPDKVPPIEEIVRNISETTKSSYLTAGSVFARKVIVQSERARQVYIRIFEERFGNTRGIAKDKYIALGNPKFDKAINSKREDFDMPKDWRDLIEGKKVILYNSSIGATLRDNESYLNKLLNILETFSKRDDVVLWWRPHPLLESTYKSMRPQFADIFNRLILGYKNEKWGIYDDTPHLHRALVWSDAYYGDLSSVLTMYLASGKPAIVSDSKILKANEGPEENTSCNSLFEPSEMETEYGCYYMEDENIQLCHLIDYVAMDDDISNEHIRRNQRQEVFKKIYTKATGASGQAIFDYVKQL